MNGRNGLLLLLLATMLGWSLAAQAAPDNYMGDSSIYIGVPEDRPRPNVLFIIDTSQSSLNSATGEAYDEPFTDADGNGRYLLTGTAYPQADPTAGEYLTSEVYYVDNLARWRHFNTNLQLGSVNCVGSRVITQDDGSTYTQYTDLHKVLATNGTYSGAGNNLYPNLASNGTCATGSGGVTFATGDYLNFIQQQPPSTVASLVIARGTNASKIALYRAMLPHTVPAAASYVNTTTDTCSLPATTVGGNYSLPSSGSCWDAYWTKVTADKADNAGNRDDFAALYPGVTNWAYGASYIAPAVIAAATQREIFYRALDAVITARRGQVDFGAMVYGTAPVQGAKFITNGTNASYMSNLSTSDTALQNFLYLLPKRDLGAPGFDVATGDGPAPVNAGPQRPQAEALYDAGHYLRAVYPSGNNPYNTVPQITTSAENPCGYKHIILLTNGLPNGEGTSSSGIGAIGDADGDQYPKTSPTDTTTADERYYGLGTHYLDDVAYYLFHPELRYDASTTTGAAAIAREKIRTHVLLAFQAEDELLKNAAEDGGGTFMQASNTAEVIAALEEMIRNIVAEESTAFVAPVVPASTTNRTISSNRVYLGLFRPQINQPWHGNLKKYKVRFGTVDGLEGADGTLATDANGDFIEGSKSFWGTGPDAGGNTVIKSAEGNRGVSAAQATSLGLEDYGDGGIVDAGGAGGTLVGSNIALRRIFTYIGGTKTFLRAPSTDTAIPLNYVGQRVYYGPTPEQMGMADPDDDAAERVVKRDKLTDFLYGYDSYSTLPQSKRDWVLGDILHSRPVVFNYSKYADEDEPYCSDAPRTHADGTTTSYNSSVIFVGANDGMLHAFRDCDAKELWSFVPPKVLKDLQYLPSGTHYYYVDSAPTLYVHDTLNDNFINSAQGDRVILLFGLRRGGGKNHLVGDDNNTATDDDNRGAYYALDITNPTDPYMLWEASHDTAGLEEMGETWTQPRLAKLFDGTNQWVVAFVGAGYDNNEDLRFGSVTSFPSTTDNTTDTAELSNDGGLDSSNNPKTSASGDTPHNPRGRGLFAIKLAKLANQTFTLVVDGVTTNVTKLAPVTSGVGGGTPYWTLTYGASTTTAGSAVTSSAMTYSIPSDLTLLDSNGNGFADLIYVGDTGGRMWRIYLDEATGNTYANIILDANSGADSTDQGRKFFYRPAVAYVKGYPTLYFGSGDREHPLNMDVTDRVYMLRDRGQGLDPSDAVDDTITEADLLDVTENLLQGGTAEEVQAALDALDATTNFGWYIQLDENAGEKPLANAVVFNGEAFYTTYTPNLSSSDPCKVGNLGVSRLYHLDYLTGEAVYNYDAGNDTGYVALAEGSRAKGEAGKVLLRTDRMKTLGEGIPSGIVTLIDASGKVTMMISSSNKVGTYKATDAKLITPVYWMEW